MLPITILTRKGQITVPLEIRKKLGLSRGQRIGFEEVENLGVVLKPLREISSLFGFFKTQKKYSKEKARSAYLGDVLKRRV